MFLPMLGMNVPDIKMSSVQPNKSVNSSMKKDKKSSLQLALKYEAAWHKLYFDLSRWKQDAIIKEPHGRHADELAHEVAVYVESMLLDVYASGSSPK